MSERRKVLKTTGLLGLLTLLSRFTGLARDMIMAALLGSSRLSSVFLNAFELSNLARRVLGEGALSAFVVPLFADRRRKSEEEGWAFTNRALNAVGGISVALTILGMLFSAAVFHLFGGYGLLMRAAGADPVEAAAIKADVAHGAMLTRLMFPNLAALAIGSIMMGVCNALDSFTAPALGSVILNFAMIIAGALALFLRLDPHVATVWLGWGVLLGAALRMAVMAPPMIKRGWLWRPDFQWRDPEIRTLYKMMAGGLFGLSINQINMSVDGVFANYVSDACKAQLTFANRLIQFPMALTATAMATAMTPQIARHMAEERHAELRSLMGFLKRVELVLIIPATLGLMFFAQPIVRLILERGKWDAAGTAGTAKALFYFAPALIPFGWSRLILPIFYARRDTATPVKAAFVAMFINCFLDAFFTFGFPTMAQGGLAFATTCAAFVNYGYLTWALSRDPARPLADGRSTEALLKCTLAGLVSIGGMRLAYEFAQGPIVHAVGRLGLRPDSSVARASALLPAITAAALLYFVFARLFRVPDSEEAFDKILRRLRRGRKRAPLPASE